MWHKSICCVAFCYSVRSILVIRSHSHQRCWRALSPFLSADRGLVLSQTAQGERHAILQGGSNNSLAREILTSVADSVSVDTYTRCQVASFLNEHLENVELLNQMLEARGVATLDYGMVLDLIGTIVHKLETSIIIPYWLRICQIRFLSSLLIS